ncbi:nucleic-acid-binding protein from transposon X-element [Trichonephila inaurata madagascariensis]|uniref:Nucleic-acid-binding protein from transposon X-element n=1 Tax=Trichonephila inaurata madagascariensis TaxID=2747483 RepID=A0A8X6YCA4_9ARAC|nr:nucleic-acid-binding protein from transposon X-element [Trichonephila inaurata madagascariensis]GFY69447.1 nucleic-acid-binding protein from transposon X-element [Trichonephila inaurata madagascariensis]
MYTEAYLDFHKSRENSMNSSVTKLNSCRASEEVTSVIRAVEELDSKLREFPFNLQHEQSTNLRHLSDVLDEARFKFTHIRKQELAEQNKLLQAQIDAWGLPSRPIDAPFQVVLSKKKGRRNSGDAGLDSKKAKTDDEVASQNKFSGLEINQGDSMDATDPQEGTSATSVHPSATAPQKKLHVPPITIDNVKNQAALLKHLQTVTKQKLEAKLIGTKFRIYPQTPYAYHQIRRYVDENSLEAFTYMLPEDKKLRAVIRGLPIDMSPSEIIADLAVQGFNIEECHNMQIRKTGQPMSLFMLSMERTEKHKTIFKKGFSHSSKYCTRTPRCVKCAKNHLAKDCPKQIDEKPKCCLCDGKHPTNFLGCPKNPRHKIAEEKEKKLNAKKKIHVVPEPPKVNFWEECAKTATQRQQPKPTIPPTASTSSSKQSNSPDFTSDIFDELKNPAVQETFELLEQFIEIATTIPTKYGRLRAFSKLFKDELKI